MEHERHIWPRDSNFKPLGLPMNMDFGSSDEPQEKGAKPSARALFLLFLGGTGIAALHRLCGWSGQEWTEALWLALALGLTFLWSRRNLPLQNILLAVVSLSAMGWFAELVSEAIPRQSDGLPGFSWVSAPKFADYGRQVAWAVLLLNSRGVAKLLIGRRAKSPKRGLWILAFSSALACAFNIGLWAAPGADRPGFRLENGATLVAGYVFALFCLALTTPALLMKRPGPEVTSIEPVWIWASLNCLAIAAAISEGNWMAVMFQGVTTVVVSWAATRSSRLRDRGALIEDFP